MAPLQSGKNILVAYKAQTGIGVPASGAGSSGLRLVPSPGLQLNKQIIASNEVRRDGQSTRGRHGTKSISGSYQSELSVTSLETLIAAAMRSTFTAPIVVDQTTMTSITTPTTSTIVAAAGSWLTQGVRRGDLIQLTNYSVVADNAIWYRVVAVTATTITVAGTPLTVNAVADASFSITVAKTLISGAVPVETYFTFEEYGQDIDAGPVYTDVKVTKLELSMQPNQPILATITLMGLGANSVSGAGAPNFTTPTFTTTLPLVMSDGTIRINGVDYSVLSGFSIALDLGGQTPATLSTNSPDVFLSNAKLSGSFSIMRADTSLFDAFNAETQIDLFVHCSQAGADPKSFVAFYVGNATLSGNQSPLGSDGPLVETVPWNAGKDEGGADRPLTMLKVVTG